MSATPGDHPVHLLEVELAAGRVELVDLVGHPEQLVLGPAQPAQPAAVAVLLVGAHLRVDEGLERLPRSRLALGEGGVDLGVEPVEDRLHVLLGRGEDALDLRGDLGALGLVLGLGLGFRGDQRGQRRALAGLHAGDPGGRLGRGVGLVLGDDLLLVLPELRGRGLRVCGGGLLVGQRLLELRFVRLRELLLGDLALGHLLVGLVRSGGEVELLGRGRLGGRARSRDGRGLARLLGRHRGDRLRDGLRLVRRRVGGRLDVLCLPVLPAADQAGDLALDLAGLPGLLVVVGLLERLRATSPRSRPSPRR